MFTNAKKKNSQEKKTLPLLQLLFLIDCDYGEAKCPTQIWNKLILNASSHAGESPENVSRVIETV